MVHRRILTDDWKGMGEGVDEKDPWNEVINEQAYGLRIITSHAVILNAVPEEARKAEDYFNEPLQAFFGKSANQSNNPNHEFQNVPNLPAAFNAHWRPIDAHNSILRIQNISREDAFIYNI